MAPDRNSCRRYLKSFLRSSAAFLAASPAWSVWSVMAPVADRVMAEKAAEKACSGVTPPVSLPMSVRWMSGRPIRRLWLPTLAVTRPLVRENFLMRSFLDPGAAGLSSGGFDDPAGAAGGPVGSEEGG